MMIWLLKCLVIHLLNYQQLSLPNTLISNLGPTDYPNSVTPRWTTSAISQTLVNSDFPILNSVSPKHELPRFCNLLSSNRCHRDDEVGPTETGKLLSFARIGLTEIVFSVPPKTPTFTLFELSVSPSCPLRSHRDCSNVCNGWILCGGYLYPSTPSSFVERAIRKNYHSYLTFLRRELPTLVLRSSCSTPTIWSLISNLPKLLSTQSFLPP